MIQAPEEYSSDYCDLRHETISKALNGMNHTVEKVDGRVFKLLVVALSQAGALIVAGIAVAFKLL